MPLIELNNGKVFEALENVNIVSAAKSEGFTLAYSCRDGRCGACKAKVVSGESKILSEEIALSKNDADNNYILTCCRSAISDIRLAVDDLSLFSNIDIKILPCRIKEITNLSDDVMKIILKLPPRAEYYFLPGQYINVFTSNKLRRSYSIANKYCETNSDIELHIKKVVDGVMSDYWFNSAKINDLLRFEGPLGTFCNRNVAKSNIVFLATGTGIAPIKAMIDEMSDSAELYKNQSIYIYWGARCKGDIYRSFECVDLNFEFRQVLSRPHKEWQGRVGYVQDAVVNDRIDLSDTVVYACGSERMIHSSRQLFLDNKLGEELFFSDAFLSSE